MPSTRRLACYPEPVRSWTLGPYLHFAQPAQFLTHSESYFYIHKNVELPPLIKEASLFFFNLFIN